MKSIKTRYQIPALLAVVLSLACTTFVQAQGMHTTARNIGLGGGGGAYMTGYHANFINPANLMLPDRDRKVTVGVLGGFSTGVGGGMANIGLYNKHFTNGDVIDLRKALEISDEWFGSSADAMNYLAFNVNVVPLGISYRRDNMAFSVALRSRVMTTTGLSKGLFELALTGLNSESFGQPKNVSLTNELLVTNELSFGYAMEVWRSTRDFEPGTMRVFAGVAPKIMFGMGYSKVGLESTLQVTGQDTDRRIIHDFEYYVLTIGNLTDGFDDYYQERRVRNNKDADFGDYVDDDSFSDLGGVMGTGLGFDLGATFEWYIQDVNYPVIGSGPQILRASLSLVDLGSIGFDTNAGEFRAVNTFTWEGLDIDFDRINEEYEDLDDYFDYVLEDSIASDIYGNFSPRVVSSHNVTMNPLFNLGTSLTMGKLGVMMDIGKGYNNRGINSTRMYMALGTEYNLVNVIPIRLGVRMGGYSAASYSFGTGLNFKSFEFTLAMMGSRDSSNGGLNVMAGWSGLVFRF